MTPRFVPAFRSFLRTDIDPGVIGAYLRLVDLVEEAGGVLRVEAVRGGPVAILKRLTLCSRAVAIRLLAVEGDGRPKVEVAIDRDGAVTVGLVALPGLERHALRLGDESREEAEQRREKNATRSRNAEKCARYRASLRNRQFGADTRPDTTRDTDTADTADTVSRHRDTDTRHRVATPEKKEGKTGEEKIREKKIQISPGGGDSALPSMEGGVATPTPATPTPPTPATPTPRRWEAPTPLAVPSVDPRSPLPDPSAPLGAPSGALAPPSGVGSECVSGEGGTVGPSGPARRVLGQPDGLPSVAHRPPLRLPSGDPRATVPVTAPVTPSVTPRDEPADGPETPAPPAFLAALGSIGGGGQGALRARPRFEPPPLERPATAEAGWEGQGQERTPAPGSLSPIPPSSPPSPPRNPPQATSLLGLVEGHPYAPHLGLDVTWLCEELRDASRGREPAHVLAAVAKGLTEVAALKLTRGPARGKLLAYARNASTLDLPAEARPPKEEPKEELPEGWHFPAAIRAALERYQAKQTLGLCLDPVEAERVFVENDEGHGYSVRSVRMRRSEWVPAVLRYLRRQADRVGAYLPAELKSDALAGLDPSTCLAGLPPRGRRTEPRPEGAVTRAEADETRGATQRLAVHLAKAGLPFPGQPTGTSTT